MSAAGIVALAGAAAALVVAGRTALLLLMIALSLFAAGALFRLARVRGALPVAAAGHAGIVALLVTAHVSGERAPAFFPAVLAATVLVAFAVLIARRNRARVVSSLLHTILPVLWVGLLGAYVPALRDVGAYGFRLVAVLLAMVVANRAGSGLFDAVRARALATSRDPGEPPADGAIKSWTAWENIAAGAVATYAVGVAAAGLLDPPFTLRIALALSLLVSIAAPAGELVGAALAADRPEHQGTPARAGGSLIPIEGLLASAPVFFYAFRALAR